MKKPNTPGEPIKAALIDDDPSFLELTKKYIEKEPSNIIIKTYSSPTTFIKNQETTQFDVIISDYQMTEIDGLQLYREIKTKNQETPPYILLTGRGKEEIAMKALNMGVERYIQKTGNPKTLYKNLAQTITSEADKHRSHKKLRQKEARLKSFIEGNKDPIYIIDENLQYIYANQTAKQTHGQKNLKGKNYRDHHTEKEAERLKKYIQKALKNNETQIYTSKTNQRYIENTITPIQTKDRDEVTVIARDITKQRERQRKLLKYKEIIQQTQDPTMIKNKEGKITLANQATAKKLRKTKEELINTHINQHIPEKIGKGLWKYEKRAIEWNETVEFTMEIPLGNTEHHIEITSTPLQNKENKPEGVIVKWRDITKEKTMEQGLREEIINRFESERKLETLLNSIPSPVIYLDREQKITKTNKAFKKLTGQEKLKNKKPTPEIKPLIQETNKKTREIEYTDPDGNQRTLLATKATYSNPKTKNKVDGTVHIYQDITDIRRIEEREKLIHSIMRHDIKNKIQIIKGYLGLIEEQNPTQPTDKYLKKTQKAVNESHAILQKVRTLKRIEKTGEIKPQNLHTITTKAIRRNQEQLQENQITIKNQTQNTMVMADPLLEEVFSNLIENSIKHGKPTTIKIKTREQKNHIEITYSDNGKGIPEKQKPKIFQKGYSGKSDSTGLGMYLTKKIIEGYNGEIKINKKTETGAEFQIKLKKP